MRKVLFSTVLMVSGFSFALEKNEMNRLADSEIQEISATRKTYLEKMTVLERQLADIDLKWNWVITNPQEDSIAKAEGWYTFMEARKQQLEAEVVQVKLEQLVNYYSDILKFPETEETIRIKLIPEMQATRKTTAPDYPEHTGYIPASETEVTALENWILNFPDQYVALTNSLESFVTYYL